MTYEALRTNDLAAKGPVIVVGAGGHALVSIEVLRGAGHVVRGCVAAHVGAAKGLERLEVPVLGPDYELAGLLADGEAVFVAVGDNEARRRLIDHATSAGGTLVSAVSPAAVVSSSASIGPGALVMPGAVVNALASVRQGAVVNTGAVIEHECVVGESAHIAPGAVLAGNVHVGDEALVGVGARVIPGRLIGNRAVVGAGAVVIADVPDGATVVGVPARAVSDTAAPAVRSTDQLQAVVADTHETMALTPEPQAGHRPTVLMVCTGNLCRSPLAEALLRRDLGQAGLGAEVTSAGIAAPTSAIPDKKLQRVAEERGVDVAAHRSRRLTTDDVASADLVLVMTRAQAKQVLDLDPSAAGRVVTLRAAAWKARALSGRRMTFPVWAASLTADVPEAERAWSSSQDIDDPIGRSLRRYRDMAGEVEASVASLVRSWPTM